MRPGWICPGLSVPRMPTWLSRCRDDRCGDGAVAIDLRRRNIDLHELRRPATNAGPLPLPLESQLRRAPISITHISSAREREIVRSARPIVCGCTGGAFRHRHGQYGMPVFSTNNRMSSSGLRVAAPFAENDQRTMGAREQNRGRAFDSTRSGYLPRGAGSIPGPSIARPHRCRGSAKNCAVTIEVLARPAARIPQHV